MPSKIRIFLEITEGPREPALLPLPLALIIVSLIWFWVRVHLALPEDSPLFHGVGPLVFGDVLATAVGIGGILYIAFWLVSLILSIVLWIKDTIESIF